MLILNLMSSCNCKCPFCCVRDEIARSQVIPPEYLKARIAEQPRDTIIDFFGGEPTLYPHFFEILSYAREKGHKCRIATNGRIFSSSKFSKRVAELGVDQIRTSIYGHTDELHDYHTDAKHSFKQTVNGIRNLLNLNINLFVNTVITSKNVCFLPEIVEMLHDLGVKNIKFGSLTDSQHVLDLIPDPEEVRTFLRAALNHAEQHHMAYALEKSPLCLIPNHYEVCVYEPDEYLYQKLEACVECIGREMCVGFPKEQVYKFGQLIAQPLPSELTSPEFLSSRIIAAENHEFVSWEDLVEDAVTAIVKVTSTCNLTCDYCYAARNFLSSKTIMPIEVAESLIRQLADTNYKRIDLNWHGGEPLIADMPFFREVLELQKSASLDKDRSVTNRLQTNGTLVNKDWAKLFDDLGLDIGISLDGPENVHDSHRRNHNRKGSFQQIIGNIDTLAQNQTPIELLCVITPDSMPYTNEIYYFFSNLGEKYPGIIESVNFMPSFEINRESGSLLPSTLSPQDYASFMINLFDHWFSEDNPCFRIYFFEEVITVLLGGKATLCHLKRGCNGFITVEPSGDVFPCDRFSGISQFNLGNIFGESLHDILSGQKRQDYKKDVDTYPSTCMNCEWFRVCHGGCLYESYALTKRLDQPTYYCEGLIKVFTHIDSKLNEHSDGYKRYLGINEI